MPSSFEPQVYAECCKKLVESLKTAHSTFCCWVSHPSPESFLRLPLSSRAMAEMEFVSQLKSLLHLQTELPRIETAQLESMGLTRVALLSLRHYAGIADQSCDDGSHDQDDMFCSACMLAVCGWASSSSVGASQLRCRYCNRTAGLWNYHTYSSPCQSDVCDESHDSDNSSSPGGETCDTQSKSHDRSNGSPTAGTACDPTPESSSVLDTSVGDSDEQSTGSDSQEEDLSGKGMSSSGDDARDEGGERRVMGENREQDADSRSGSISIGYGDIQTENRVNDESGAENGLTDNRLADEDSVQQIESDILPESSEEDIEQTESDKKEHSEEMGNDSEEWCIHTESDNDKNIEQTETDQEENVEQIENDKEEHIKQTESYNKEHVEQTKSDNEEHIEQTESDNEENIEQTESDNEHADRTENDKEEHVEQIKNERDVSHQSDTGSEVDTVDGYCLQEAKCFERSAKEVDVTPSDKTQDDLSQPGDLKSNSLKTENQDEHSADANECEDVGKGGNECEDVGKGGNECEDVGKGGKTVGEARGIGVHGEADEPMEVDASEADKDEASQRTTTDDGGRGCSTGQQCLDSGQNGMASHTGGVVEPAAKRRKIMKPSRVTFDPIAEHHTWCPWVLPDAPADRSNDTLTSGDEDGQPGWRRFLKVLTPADSQQTHSLISIVKTSPPCVGLRSIRKLFLGWTRSATPDS